MIRNTAEMLLEEIERLEKEHDRKAAEAVESILKDKAELFTKTSPIRIANFEGKVIGHYKKLALSEGKHASQCVVYNHYGDQDEGYDDNSTLLEKRCEEELKRIGESEFDLLVRLGARGIPENCE